MPLRLDVAPGSEHLIPFAKKKLAELKSQTPYLLNKRVLVNTGEEIFIQRGSVDLIRVRGAGTASFYWAYTINGTVDATMEFRDFEHRVTARYTLNNPDHSTSFRIAGVSSDGSLIVATDWVFPGPRLHFWKRGAYIGFCDPDCSAPTASPRYVVSGPVSTVAINRNGSRVLIAVAASVSGNTLNTVCVIEPLKGLGGVWSFTNRILPVWNTNGFTSFTTNELRLAGANFQFRSVSPNRAGNSDLTGALLYNGLVAVSPDLRHLYGVGTSNDAGSVNVGHALARINVDTGTYDYLWQLTATLGAGGLSGGIEGVALAVAPDTVWAALAVRDFALGSSDFSTIPLTYYVLKNSEIKLTRSIFPDSWIQIAPVPFLDAAGHTYGCTSPTGHAFMTWYQRLTPFNSRGTIAESKLLLFIDDVLTERGTSTLPSAKQVYVDGGFYSAAQTNYNGSLVGTQRVTAGSSVTTAQAFAADPHTALRTTFGKFIDFELTPSTRWARYAFTRDPLNADLPLVGYNYVIEKRSRVVIAGSFTFGENSVFPASPFRV